MLQALLHVETGLEHHPVPVTAQGLKNETHCKLKSVEGHFNGKYSEAASTVSDARVQRSDNTTLVPTGYTANVAVDPATVFYLSQDDFNDDIDDISFINLPQHSELPHGSEVTSDRWQATATTSSKQSSLSLVSDVISITSHPLQLRNDCAVENVLLAENENQSFTTSVDFTHKSGKYFLHNNSLTLLVLLVNSMAKYWICYKHS